MIEQAVQDAWGNISSRRIAGFIGLAMMAGAGAAAYLGHPVGDHLFDAVATFTFGCFGLATTDHFAPSAHQEPTNAAPSA